MIWKWVGRWAIAAIAVPLAAAGVRKVGQAVEARRGQNRATRMLRGSADFLQRTAGRKPRRSRLRPWR